MARTDKDAPFVIRLERGEVNYYGDRTVIGATYRERGYGRRGVKAAKRLAGKRRRQNCQSIRNMRELDFTTLWTSA